MTSKICGQFVVVAATIILTACGGGGGSGSSSDQSNNSSNQNNNPTTIEESAFDFWTEWVRFGYSHRPIRNNGVEFFYTKVPVVENNTYRIVLRSYTGNSDLFVYSEFIADDIYLIDKSENIGAYNDGDITENFTDTVEITATQTGFLYIAVKGQDTVSALVTYVVSPYLEDGFPVDTFSLGGTYNTGAAYNHITVGNIDDDPELELISPSLNDGLYAWNYDGTQVDGWPLGFAGYSHLSLGNLTGDDDKLEVVIQRTWVEGFRSCTINRYAVDQYGIPLSGWPLESCRYGISPPRLFDTDDDGLDEVFLREDVFFSDATEVPGWSAIFDAFNAPLSESLEDFKSFADINNDGSTDVLFVTLRGGVYAYNKDGTSIADFYAPESDMTRRVIHAPLVVGDINGDGYKEIIRIFGGSPSNLIEALDYQGNVLWQRNTLTSSHLEMAPALGDLDGDLIPELVVQTDGVIHVYKGDGSYLEGWPSNYGSPEDETSGIRSANALIGDVTGDGLQNVVVTTNNSIEIFSNAGVLLESILHQGANNKQHAIADIDLDGRNEIIVAFQRYRSSGVSDLYEHIWVYDLGGSNSAGIEWGQFGGNPKRSGAYSVDN